MKLYNEKTKVSICNKSISKGLFAESKNLTFEEYEFIRKSCNFPQIPINSKSIYLKYYEDDFLGDYSTEIHFNIGIKDTFNNIKRWKSEEWIITNIDSINKFKTVLYTDFMN